ncbi:hypothetical protein CBM2587_A120138 [Cupriavidus taiwanensis]|uniref:Uncharacterized protein n=1 Tax=Cupriavidus taiwanensis TaxID=164546 RepID=A0A975WV40_9BURK|nr:hypothetical protein CBM2587_A120138 [Cupriavidus taiwanensis]
MRAGAGRPTRCTSSRLPPSPQPSPASGRGSTHRVIQNPGGSHQKTKELAARHAVRRMETPCR